MDRISPERLNARQKSPTMELAARQPSIALLLSRGVNECLPSKRKHQSTQTHHGSRNDRNGAQDHHEGLRSPSFLASQEHSGENACQASSRSAQKLNIT